jgi:hypothetical protein
VNRSTAGRSCNAELKAHDRLLTLFVLLVPIIAVPSPFLSPMSTVSADSDAGREQPSLHWATKRHSGWTLGTAEAFTAMIDNVTLLKCHTPPRAGSGSLH